MAFTVSDLEEMMRLLQENPAKREALRVILLGEELLQLPEQVARLTTVVERLVETVQRLEETQREMLVVQQQHTQAIQQLQETQQAMLVVQQQHTQAIQGLQETQQAMLVVQQQHTQAIQQLQETQQAMLVVQQQHTQAIQGLQETQREMLVVQQQHTQAIQSLQEGQQQNTQAIRELRQYVERVANAYGLTLEGEAEDALEYMARQKGWKFLKPPHPLRTDIEIDLIAVCEDAQGQHFTVIVEVKARLAQRTVREWANRIRADRFRNRLAELGYPSPYYMYIMGFRIDPQAEEAARELRIGLFDPRGERVEPEPLS